jgi:hypothetical protein
MALGVVTFPELGTDISAYDDYTLDAGITAAVGQLVNLFEVDGDGKLLKAGYAMAVVEPDAPPELTFTCTDHATEASTQIASVSPALTGGNSYLVAVGEFEIPEVGLDMTEDTDFAAYTLTDAIAATNGDTVTLVEIDADSKVVKGGQALAVVE